MYLWSVRSNTCFVQMAVWNVFPADCGLTSAGDYHLAWLWLKNCYNPYIQYHLTTPSSYPYAMIYMLLLSLFWKGNAVPEAGPDTTPVEDSLTIRILNYEKLKPMLHVENDTTYVVNFWATWCSPCMAEMPYFLALDSLYADKPMKLLLVSLDFKKDYLRKLQPFVKSKGLEDKVVVLEDNNANFWINDIEPSWGGAIPATLVYKNGQRTFFERTFHHVDELKEIVDPYLDR